MDRRPLCSEGPCARFDTLLLEIINDFIFELVFCEQNPMGQGSTSVRRGSTYDVCVPMHMQHTHRIPRIPGTQAAWRVQGDSK